MTPSDDPANTEKGVKAYVIGSESVVASFQLMGIPGTIIASPDDVVRELEHAVQDDVQIVILDEGLAKPVEKRIAQVRRAHAVTIVTVPRPFSVESPRDFSEFLAKTLGIRL